MTSTMDGPGIKGSAKRRAPGLVNFIPALAYHFCLKIACRILPTWGPPFSRALYILCRVQCCSSRAVLIKSLMNTDKVNEDAVSIHQSIRPCFGTVYLHAPGAARLQ